MSKTHSKRKRARHLPKESRRNLKNWAVGARESVLSPHVEAYADAEVRGWKAERDYWQRVCSEYHARINWRLKDHEEPPTPLPPFDPEAIIVDEELSQEQKTARSERISVLNNRIRRWLKYRSRKLKKLIWGNKIDPRKNPYAVLVGQLSGISAPPKARQAYQQFMHESYTTEIDPVVLSRWQEHLKDQGLSPLSLPNAAFRAKVARDLFKSLPPEEQIGLAQRAKDAAQAARDQYEQDLKKGISLDPLSIQNCVDRIPSFLSPIIRGIQERTSYKFTLFYGGPCPRYDGQVTGYFINFGRNRAANPVPFTSYKKDHFDNTTWPMYKEWLKSSYSQEEIDLASLKSVSPQDVERAQGNRNDNSSDSETSESDSEESEEDSESDRGDEGPSKKRPRIAQLPKPAKKTKATHNSPSRKRKANPSSSTPASASTSHHSKASKTRRVTAPAVLSQAALQHPPSETPRLSIQADPREDIPTHDTGSQPPVHGGPLANTSTPAPSLSATTTPSPAGLGGDGSLTQGSSNVLDAPAGSSASSSLLTHSPLPTDQPPPTSSSTPILPSGPTPANTLLPPLTSPQRPPSPLPSASSPPSATTAPTTDAAASVATGSSAVNGLDTLSSPVNSLPLTCPSNAMPWFKDAFQTLTAVSLGHEYTDAIRLFCDIESVYEFKNPKTGLSTRQRPDELKRWIAGGRWRVRAPVVNNPDRFAKTWWMWWKGLQPGWRDISGDRPVIVDSYGEDWDSLRYPGQNGLLSVVATLGWWGIAVSEQRDSSAYADWLSAVSDVNWMLKGLLQAIAAD